jgi:hypothetical protein
LITFIPGFEYQSESILTYGRPDDYIILLSKTQAMKEYNSNTPVLPLILLIILVTFSGCEKEGMADDGGYNICKSGNIVALSTNDGCILFDVTNPASPSTLARINVGYSDGVAIKDNTLFISSDGSLNAYDISSPQSPVKTGSLTYDLGSICLWDTLLFIRSSSAVEIINITDPANMKKEGSYNFGTINYGNGIYTTGNRIYVATGVLQQFSYSSDFKISLVKSFSLSAFSITSNGKYLYATTYDDGARIINIEDDNNVRQESFISLGKSWGITHSEGFIYVVNPWSGVTMIDISNVKSPVVVSKTKDKYQAHGIFYDGGYLYVAGTIRGFFILDAEDLSVVYD